MAKLPLTRQARHRDRLASKRTPTFLEVEKPSDKDGLPRNSQGNPRAHSKHECFECSVGSTKTSRRAAQARNRSVSGYGREIYAEASEAAFPDLADLPGKSRQTISFRGFLRGTHRDFPDSVRVSCSGSRSQAHLHFNVTEHPSAEWTAAQIVQAFPWDKAPRFLLRDRDSIYGAAFRTQARSLEISEVLAAFRSPWQSPYVERLIGSIRRECLDHIVILNEASLRRHMISYLDYYHESRCHLSLGKDFPDGRPVQPPEMGNIFALPKVGGLHHRYERCAA
jgi:hypothetical protein